VAQWAETFYKRFQLTAKILLLIENNNSFASPVKTIHCSDFPIFQCGRQNVGRTFSGNVFETLF